MLWSPKKRAFHLLIKLLFMGMPMVFLAQQRQSYEGEFKVGKYEGVANYQYIVANNDTLFDGSFKIQKSNLDHLLEGKDYSFTFNGGFDQDYPEGFWRFDFGEFQSDGTSQIIDGQYQVKVSGIQEEAYGIIRKGKPNGQWVFMVNQIENSALIKTLFRSTFQFENGVAQKSFRVENDKSTLVGRFLRDGLAHDEWTLYGGDEGNTTESWYFKNGVLSEIRKGNGSETVTAKVFNEVSANAMATVNLDSNYITLLKIKQSTGGINFSTNSLLAKLLDENAKHYENIDFILSDLGQSAFFPEFKARVPYYPLDSLKTAKLDTIKNLVVQSDSISSLLLEDTHLNLVKLSDDQTAFLYQVVQEISEKFVTPLKKVVHFQEAEILSHIAPADLKKTFWPNGIPSKEIIIATKDSQLTYAGLQSEQYHFDFEGIDGIDQIVQYAVACLSDLQNKLNEKLSNEKRQQQFVDLEEDLIEKSTNLNQQIEQTKDTVPEHMLKALLTIKKFADQKLSEYSATEESSDKLVAAEQVLECLSALNRLSEAVVDMPQNWKKIQEKYTDQVWNPFTATIMDELIKKRFLNAYRKVLEPYLLESIQTNLSCDNAQNVTNLIQESYIKMLELRDAETSKLERKLKRKQNPETVLQLFELQSLSMQTKL